MEICSSTSSSSFTPISFLSFHFSTTTQIIYFFFWSGYVMNWYHLPPQNLRTQFIYMPSKFYFSFLWCWTLDADSGSDTLQFHYKIRKKKNVSKIYKWNHNRLHFLGYFLFASCFLLLFLVLNVFPRIIYDFLLKMKNERELYYVRNMNFLQQGQVEGKMVFE